MFWKYMNLELNWNENHPNLTYIIFSTIDLVSPSKSDSLEFSGWTLLVFISGSVVTNLDHHSILLIFSRLIIIFLERNRNYSKTRRLENECWITNMKCNCLPNYLLSSRFQTHSSALTSCNRSPSIIDSGLPLIATYIHI